MLRANHLVNRHEQGVRTMGRAGRATVERLRSARIRGGHEVAALVVRNENILLTLSADVLGGIRVAGVLGRYWGTQIPFLSLSRG